MNSINIDDYDNDDIKALKFAQEEQYNRKYVIKVDNNLGDSALSILSNHMTYLLIQKKLDIKSFIIAVKEVCNTTNIIDREIAIEYFDVLETLVAKTIEILEGNVEEGEELFYKFDSYLEFYKTLKFDNLISKVKKLITNNPITDKNKDLILNLKIYNYTEKQVKLRDLYPKLEKVLNFITKYDQIEQLRYSLYHYQKTGNIKQIYYLENEENIILNKEYEDILKLFRDHSKKNLNIFSLKAKLIQQFRKENKKDLVEILKNWKIGNNYTLISYIKKYSLDELEEIIKEYVSIENFIDYDNFMLDKRVLDFSTYFQEMAIYSSLIKVETITNLGKIVENEEDNLLEEDFLSETTIRESEILGDIDETPNPITILDRINLYFTGNLEYKTFESYTQLIDERESLVNELETLFERETKHLDNIENMQKTLLHYEIQHRILVEKCHLENNLCDLDMSDYQIEATNYLVTPYLDDKPVTIYDGEMIFSKSEVMEEIPYIAYVSDSGRIASKIYRGKPLQKRPQYEQLIINHNKKKSPNHIYIHLWKQLMLKKNAYLSNVNTKDLVILDYDLNINVLEIVSPTKNNINYTPRVFMLIEKLFHMLDLSRKTVSYIQGLFYLWKFEYNESSFLHQLLCDRIFNNYFYMDEGHREVSTKITKSLPIYMKTSSNNKQTKQNKKSLHFNMIRNVLLDNKKISVTEANPIRFEKFNKIVEMPKNSSFLTIKFKAYNKEQVSNFMFIFHSLLCYYYYNNLKSNIIYQSLNETSLSETLNYEIQFKDSKNVDSFRFTKISSEEINIDDVKNNIKTECEAVRVDYLTEEDLENADFIIPDEIFNLDGIQYMLYPSKALVEKIMNENGNVEVNRSIYTSKRKDIPNMGIVKYHYGKERYHIYRPYAFTTAQRNTSIFNDYCKGILDNKTNLEKIKKTERYIIPSARAYIAEELTNILISKTNQNSAENILRIGMPYSMASIIHCILYAKEDEEYMSKKTFLEKEKFVKEKRIQIASDLKNKKFHIELLQQQMWDFSDEEIYEYFLDLNSYLDIALVYNLLEYYYDINIYWFIQPDTSKGESSITIGLPRFKNILCRPVKERKTIGVIICKGDRSNQRQCELICMNKELLLEKSKDNIYHSIMNTGCSNIYWSGEVSYKSLIGYKNLFTYYDIIPYFISEKYLNAKLISQHIDSYGKTRGFNLILKNKKRMTILTYPISPINLPKTNKFYYVSYSDAINILGEPSRKSLNNNKRITALWYSLYNIDEIFQVPIIVENDDIPDLPIGYPLCINNIRNEIVNRVIKIDSINKLVKELFLLSFSLYYKDTNLIDVFYFMKEYTTVAENVNNIDSVKFYNFSKLERKLPQIENLEDYLTYLEDTCDTLVKNNNFIFYSENYRNKMKEILIDHANLINEDDIIIPTHIENFYINSADYNQSKKYFTFYDKNEFSKWIENINTDILQDEVYKIYDMFNEKLSNTKQAYIFHARGDNYFLIQNSLSGFKSALYVSYYWSNKRNNIGSYVSEKELDNFDESEIPYVVYGVSSDMNIEPIFNNDQNSSNFLSVLYYGSLIEYMNNFEKDYASMLPIN